MRRLCLLAVNIEDNLIDPEYARIVERAQEILDLNCPSPEENIVRLCHIFANTPETEKVSTCARLIYEVSDLISQCRWHLGQAILITEIYPDIFKSEKDKDEIGPFRTLCFCP